MAFSENNKSTDAQSRSHEPVGISEIDNSSDLTTVQTRRPRGRPKGSGRKYPPRSKSKTVRGFSPLSEGLLSLIRLSGPEYRNLSDSEILEEALIRYGRSLSNQNPAIEAKLRKAGR